MIDRPYYLDKIRPFVGKDVIKVVSGIRRCGKSTLLELVKRDLLAQGADEQDVTSVDLERFGNRHLRDAEALYAHLAPRIAESRRRGKLHRVFLDEVQEAAGWEKLVSGLQAEGGADLYVTGSNAHFLSSEFATYLSGRYVEIDVFPLSFSEFAAARAQFKTADESAGDASSEALEDAFGEYRRLGGFPFLMNLGWQSEASLSYLSDIYNTVVLKDMVERESIGNAHRLDSLLPFLIANVGHTFSARSIQRVLRGEGANLSADTILSYIDAACRAHLLFKAPRADPATKRVFQGQEKYYVADVGLREAVYGGNDRNIDQVLENIVFLELTRHGWNVTVGRKDALPLKRGGGGEHDGGHPAQGMTQGRRSRTPPEIDFVASKGSRSVFIQVCYLLSDDATVEREFAPLEELRIDWPKYVLSLDRIDRSRNGIVHRSIPSFLLQSDDLLA